MYKWQSPYNPEAGFYIVDLDQEGHFIVKENSNWKDNSHTYPVGTVLNFLHNIPEMLKSGILVINYEPNDLLKELIKVQ